MAETLLTVRTEVLAGGLNRLGATIVNRLINDAYQWVVKRERWPFREATSTGAAPLTIADVAVVASVKDTANSNRRLSWIDRRTLEERYGDLTVAGSPQWWYFEGTVIKTFPVGGTLSVRYWKNATALSADADPLIVPDAWVQVVIDRARYRGLLRLGDWTGAASLKAEIKDTMEDMVYDQLANQASDPDQVVVYDGAG